VSAHTAGPWKWFNYPDGRKLLTGTSRAVIHCPDAAIACDEKDQALIAAAPELLDALFKLMKESIGFVGMALPATHGHTNIAVMFDRIRLAQEAIAKAEGHEASS